ncbi:MAG: fructose-bisphosphate aldolase, class [Chloroflexota bacterium]|nr:fructose-bisphosphate aldolase, class [Chloroflexota bacterium]
MNTEQMKRMRSGKGFIAALDQSGGSTPKALRAYGIQEDAFSNDKEMFDLVHEMRTRIITSPAFTSEHILAAILFKNTMNREVEGMPTADFLWEKKGIVPILKVDQGLAAVEDGVQVMKPITELSDLLKLAVSKNIFGTKMRSVIKDANPQGVKRIAEQQFELGKQIFDHGLIPILEPEVDIHSADKEGAEKLLKENIFNLLGKLDKDVQVMFKLTIPSVDDFYSDLMKDPHVVRVVALSGGYTREEANEKLARNHGLIASFSRALAEGLSANQTDEEFNQTLAKSIDTIYAASIT